MGARVSECFLQRIQVKNFLFVFGLVGGGGGK